MKYASIATCVLASAAFTPGFCETPVATLLFAQQGTQIVSETGNVRAARQGDTLQSGERLLTPAGAISQLVLADGSLIGMRPDSELKIDQSATGAGNRPAAVSLVSGAAHVIGAELMNPNKTSNFTFRSGSATLSLKGADLESAVVKPDAKQPPGQGSTPGSYQRLIAGSASVANGGVTSALAPKQVSFVGAANAAPVMLASTANNLFAPNRAGNPGASGPPTTVKGVPPAAPLAAPNLGNSPPTVKPLMPVQMPVQVPVIAPTVKPCTRFIGKTCIQ